MKLVDDLMPTYGNTRSEVVRGLVQDWLRTNIGNLADLKKLAAEAKRQKYT